MPTGSGQADLFIETYSVKQSPGDMNNNKCLIFDIRDFDEGLHVTNRDKNKADMDLANFVNTFKGLNFDIETNINLSRSQIGKKVIDVTRILSDATTIVVIVLSKGHQDYFLATDGLFKIDWIWTPLMATSGQSVLFNQPKLFIFQVEEILFTDLQSDAPSAPASEKPIPAPESDMFLIHHRIPSKFDFPNYDWSFSKAMREVFTPEQAEVNHIGKLMPKVNLKMANVYRQAEVKKEIKDKLAKFKKDGILSEETANKAATEIITKERDAAEAELKAKDARAKIVELEEIIKKTEKREQKKEQKTEKQIAQAQATRNENEGKNLREAVEKAKETLVKSVENIKMNSIGAVNSGREYVEEAKNEVQKREDAIVAAKKVLADAEIVSEKSKNASVKIRDFARWNLDAAKGEVENAKKALEEAKKEVTGAEEEVKLLEKDKEKKSFYKVDDYLSRAQEEEEKRKKIAEQMETSTTTPGTEKATVEPMEVESAAAAIEAVKEQKENQTTILHNFPSKPIVATTVSHLRKLFFLVEK